METTMTATEATALVDAGPCQACGDDQFDHKRGRGGCKVPGCGCGAYERPEPAPRLPNPDASSSQVRNTGPALEVDPGSSVPSEVPPAEPERTRAELVADLTAQSIELGTYDMAVPGDGEPTCAYPLGEDQGEHDHALCEDVVAERSEQETATESVYCADERCAQADLARRRTSHERQMRLAAERDEARVRVDALTATVARLRDDLNRATLGRQRAQDALDEAVRAGTAAATRVLWRYDAEQCETCGSRYTVPVQHEHPLTPVTVLVVRRETTEGSATAGPDNRTKEN